MTTIDRAGVCDPTPTVLELDAAREDPDARVRRRVAHGLAALSISHPTLALSIAQRWIAEGGEHVGSVVRLGLRPLVEARDATALRLAGYAPQAAVRIRDLQILRPDVRFGDTLHFSCRAVSAETRAAPVLIEYAIARLLDHGEVPVARDRLACRTVGPLDDITVRRAHRIPARPSTRWQPGAHVLVLTVNSRRDAVAPFSLRESV